MNTLVLSFCFIALAIAQNSGGGVDVSAPVSQGSAGCLNSQDNYQWAVVRCWHSYGAPDSNVVQSVANFWAAGFSNVDVYMFPCFSCGDPAGQVTNAVKYLQSNSVNFTTFWFDIEGAGTYWGPDPTANAQFFDTMMQTGSSLGINMGVYANWNSWPSIMGSYSSASSLPLWYPHYDGSTDCSDFQSFNGWSSPTMKQYSESGNDCSLSGYDINVAC
eukprot:TRINITY_DN10403_c0_g1_i1.p1 TRINITY_DN10403_c0_g1~~TRINITY_DN10403_c0_g1_i1.p1  ORF type:complete len:217 (-),score=29.04 TRINITY_DN10403_c0_g1_i1:51-701(-)